MIKLEQYYQVDYVLLFHLLQIGKFDQHVLYLFFNIVIGIHMQTKDFFQFLYRPVPECKDFIDFFTEQIIFV